MKRLSVLALVIGLLAGAPVLADVDDLLDDIEGQILGTRLFRAESVPSEMTWGLITTAFDQSVNVVDLHAADNLYINNNLGAPERDDLEEQTIIYSQLGNLGIYDVASAYATFHAAGGTFTTGILYSAYEYDEDFDGATTYEETADFYQFNIGYGRMATDNIFVGGSLTIGNGEDEEDDVGSSSDDAEREVYQGDIGLKFSLGDGSFEDPKGLLAVQFTVAQANASDEEVALSGTDVDQIEKVETEYLDLALVGSYTHFFSDRLQFQIRAGADLRDGEFDGNDLNTYLAAGSGSGNGATRGAGEYLNFANATDDWFATNDDFTHETYGVGATVLFRPSEHMDFYAGLDANTTEIDLSVGGDIEDAVFSNPDEIFAGERQIEQDTYSWKLAGRIYITEAFNIIVGAAYTQIETEFTQATDQVDATDMLDLVQSGDSDNFGMTSYRLGLSYTMNNAVQFHVGFYNDEPNSDGSSLVRDKVENESFVASAAFSF